MEQLYRRRGGQPKRGPLSAAGGLGQRRLQQIISTPLRYWDHGCQDKFIDDVERKPAPPIASSATMTVAAECQEASTRPKGSAGQHAGAACLQGSWNVRLAALLMALRGCLMGPEREFFDKVHSSAHQRQIPSSHFFSFALDVLRQHRPDLEDEFREVFRLRNQARRRAREQQKGTMRSVKSESCLQDVRGYRGTSMSRSCEDVAAQARAAESEIDATMLRLQSLCVDVPGRSVLTKRHSEINMHGDYEQKRKMCGSEINGFDILSCSP